MSDAPRRLARSDAIPALLGGCALTVILCFAAIPLAAWIAFGGRGRMTTADSPDGRYRITLDERACGLDRNFRLLLWDRDSGKERVLDCPDYDQSPMIEREQFYWSEDSRMVALVGDEFYTIPEAELPSGHWLYIVYDTADEKLYCNIDWAADRETPFPADQAVEVFGEAILADPEPIR